MDDLLPKLRIRKKDPVVTVYRAYDAGRVDKTLFGIDIDSLCVKKQACDLFCHQENLTSFPLNPLLIFPLSKTTFPLTMVATGHPFSTYPLKGLHLHLVRRSSLRTSFISSISMRVRSAS